MRKKNQPSSAGSPSYSWSNPLFVGKADPNRVHTELETLRKTKKGEAPADIQPDAVVEYARSHPRSELHKLFPWDDSEAARMYRLSVARNIVRSIRIIYPETPTEVTRVYVRPTEADGYRAIKEVASSRTAVARLRKQALTDLQSWLKRYEQIIGAMPGIRTVIDQMISMLRQSIETQAEAERQERAEREAS